MVYMLHGQVDTIARELINDINPKKLEKLNQIMGTKEFERAVLEKFFKDYLEKYVKLYDFNGITVENKDEVIAFLNDIDNVSIVNHIKVLQEHSTKLFKNPRIKLELRHDYETGNKILYFLIKSDATLEQNMISLDALDHYAPYLDSFIVDLDQSV